jgi:hypothetical protein
MSTLSINNFAPNMLQFITGMGSNRFTCSDNNAAFTTSQQFLGKIFYYFAPKILM